jgi:hypothetical protein
MKLSANAARIFGQKLLIEECDGEKPAKVKRRRELGLGKAKTCLQMQQAADLFGPVLVAKIYLRKAKRPHVH